MPQAGEGHRVVFSRLPSLRFSALVSLLSLWFRKWSGCVSCDLAIQRPDRERLWPAVTSVASRFLRGKNKDDGSLRRGAVRAPLGTGHPRPSALLTACSRSVPIVPYSAIRICTSQQLLGSACLGFLSWYSSLSFRNNRAFRQSRSQRSGHHCTVVRLSIARSESRWNVEEQRDGASGVEPTPHRKEEERTHCSGESPVGWSVC